MLAITDLLSDASVPEAEVLAVSWKNLWAVLTVPMLKEFHILKGRFTTLDTKTYTKVILNMQIEKKICQG